MLSMCWAGFRGSRVNCNIRALPPTGTDSLRHPYHARPSVRVATVCGNVWRLAFLALFAGSNPGPELGMPGRKPACNPGCNPPATLCAARAVSYTRHLTN